MPLPQAPLDPQAQASFGRFHKCLSVLSDLSGSAICAWASSLEGIRLDELPRYPGLEHRLSEAMLARTPIDRLAPRTPSEIAALPSARRLLSSALSGSPSDFAGALAALHSNICDSQPGLRTCEVRSFPDRRGSHVVFPQAHHIRPGLERLHDFIGNHLASAPGLTAAVAMTSICNLHPFSDGNGRVSRILFNALLGLSAGPTPPYVPLHELGRVSRGGFLIAMRLAQYRGEWMPLAQFLSSTAHVMESIHRASAHMSLSASTRRPATFPP